MEEELKFKPIKEIIAKKTVTREIIRETVTIEKIVTSNPTLDIVYYPMAYNMDNFCEKESAEAATIDDCEFRKGYAKLLNIEPSKTDANAFSKLYGVFDDVVPSTDKVDVTEWVRKLRRRK